MEALGINYHRKPTNLYDVEKRSVGGSCSYDSASDDGRISPRYRLVHQSGIWEGRITGNSNEIRPVASYNISGPLWCHDNREIRSGPESRESVEGYAAGISIATSNDYDAPEVALSSV